MPEHPAGRRSPDVPALRRGSDSQGLACLLRPGEKSGARTTWTTWTLFHVVRAPGRRLLCHRREGGRGEAGRGQVGQLRSRLHAGRGHAPPKQRVWAPRRLSSRPTSHTPRTEAHVSRSLREFRHFSSLPGSQSKHDGRNRGLGHLRDKASVDPLSAFSPESHGPLSRCVEELRGQIARIRHLEKCYGITR